MNDLFLLIRRRLKEPRIRAQFVVAVFSLAGIAAWLYFPGDAARDLPLVIFYAVLTMNTYPSVRLFSSITPQEDLLQEAIDVLLVAAYLFLAASVHAPLQFLTAALLVFIVAPIKYSLLLSRIPYPRTLHRKIRIDLMGTMLCIVCIIGAWAGYTEASAQALAIVFLIANIYWLLIDPMYRIID